MGDYQTAGIAKSAFLFVAPMLSIYVKVLKDKAESLNACSESGRFDFWYIP
jgi:hypothetical protein